MSYPPAKAEPELLQFHGRGELPHAVLKSHPDFPDTLAPEVEGALIELNPAWPEASVDWVLDRLDPPCHTRYEDSNADNTEEREGVTAVIFYVRPGNRKRND